MGIRTSLTAPAVSILLLLTGAVTFADAQTAAPAGEYQVKAAFLYNFAKFVEWPASSFKSNADPFRICVLGDDPFGGALQATLDGKKMQEHTTQIAHLSDVKEAGSCHIVFVSKSQKKNLHAVLGALRAVGILSVGETDDFAAGGGVIGFRLDDGRVRLEINLQAASQQQLQISSKLLSLAQIVKKP
jgi:hypothetical protein